MIARLWIITPFILCVPPGAQFKVLESETFGYKVRFYPPMTSRECAERNEGVKVILGDVEAVRVDVIQIDFIAESFNRDIDHQAPGKIDPSTETIRKVLHSFFARLRRATNGAQIQPSEFPGGNWLLRYLNDDGSELPSEEDKARGVGYCQIGAGAIGLTIPAWETIKSLPVDYSPPAWESLLLDASHPGAPPGSTIVLAFTALEVYIAFVIDGMAQIQTKPPELWGWINHRRHHEKEPSVEEQYDDLLKLYCGHSLKEDASLWEAFRNLRTARNAFVHTGKVNETHAGKSVAVATLVPFASQIIEKVSQWVPEELRWTKPTNAVELQYLRRIFPF
jgi:hypothetical protein